MATIISLQFTRLMNGDPFFYKFDPILMDEVKLEGIIDFSAVTLGTIIRDNTIISDIGTGPGDVFFV